MCHNRGMISNVRRSGSGKLFAKKEKKNDRRLLKDEKIVLKRSKVRVKKAEIKIETPKISIRVERKIRKNLLKKKSKYFRQQKNVPI